MTLKIYGREFKPEKLKALREEQGLSKAKLGRMLGVNSSSAATNRISAYETGKTIPSPKVIIKLVDVLDCYIDDIAPKTNNDYKEPKTTKGAGRAKSDLEWHPSWHWGK